ncbi:hypothetical protein NQ318_007766 [Aromia moschata]|uniref:Uncharacterized protein n=1 Tax=Aromia moschata TaxID=1265417 RepID=A0AAV8YZP1_9CUCU|nr:hypothetical protein NQ318_007766 [Aromia moschata]
MKLAMPMHGYAFRFSVAHAHYEKTGHRICLEQKDIIFSLLSTIEFKDENIVTTIPNILERLSTEFIQTEEDLPSLICVGCINLIKSAYIFQLKFEESHNILRNYISSIVNDERTHKHSDNGASESDSDFDSPLLGNQVVKEVEIKTNVFSNTIQRTRSSNGSEDADIEYSTKSPFLYPCPICTVDLPAQELKKHVHRHKALNKYFSISALKQNIKFYANPRVTKSIFNHSKILHKCPYCYECFPVQQFRIHVNNHRKQDEFKCEKCNRLFRKLNHLNTHRVKHLKEYPYKCDHCGKGFVIKSNYECHILTHTNSELPHECSYCLKRFSNPEHLHRHQTIHIENISYSIKYKVCKCRRCLKSFKDKSDLKNHVCVPTEHILNTKFRCKTCKKVFKHSSGLYSHIRNIHKFKGTKILCSVCGRHVSNIYNHMIRHTGEKQYQCNQCNKRFIAKPQLRQHLLVHSGLKPYVCSLCAKAFNNLYNLQVHERIHKGDRCHICPICSKGFLEKSYLRKHMSVHKSVN